MDLAEAVKAVPHVLDWLSLLVAERNVHRYFALQKLLGNVDRARLGVRRVTAIALHNLLVRKAKTQNIEHVADFCFARPLVKLISDGIE